jgi:nitrate reductase gamma subunit
MPVEPPQNAEYLVAGYVVTTAILLGYWLLLWRRAKKVRG